MKCFVCPRRCGVERGEHLTEKLPGVCASPRLPVVARAGLHFWEEPVISGVRGSGTVFFSGCNLHCVYCQNYEISTRHQGVEISVERLKAIYHELIAQGAHNINLVTPTHYSEAILESLAEPLPVPVVYNTNGYDEVATLRRFRGKIAVYLPDLKYAEAELGRRLSGAEDYFEKASAAIDEMFQQTGPYEIGTDGMLKKGVVVRHLVLPGHLENSRRVIDYMASRFHPGEVMFSLMRQYIPCGRVSATEFSDLNRKVSSSEYRRIEQYLFDSGFEDGFLQSGRAASREYIPCFDGSGV